MRSRSNKADSSEGIIFQIEDSMMQFGDQLDSDVRFDSFTFFKIVVSQEDRENH